MLTAYYTVIIPWVERQFATEWHPTDAAGPLSTLGRGAFSRREEAIRWAQEHLEGTPYSIQYTPPFTAIED
jgi:hypothetical protein